MRFAPFIAVALAVILSACNGPDPGAVGWPCPNDNNCRPANYCKDGECALRPPDAGVNPRRDAGVRDAGLRDAGPRDAGEVRDAGPRDAGCPLPPRLSVIQREIFEADCNQANCHGVAEAGGLRLDGPLDELHTVLLGPTTAGGAPEPNIVVPGDAAQSRLITIMSDRNPGGGGGPMPPARLNPPCDIETITVWIEDGAPEN